MYERFYISGRPEKQKVHVCEQAEKNLKSDFNILKRKKIMWRCQSGFLPL